MHLTLVSSLTSLENANSICLASVAEKNRWNEATKHQAVDHTEYQTMRSCRCCCHCTLIFGVPGYTGLQLSSLTGKHPHGGITVQILVETTKMNGFTKKTKQKPKGPRKELWRIPHLQGSQRSLERRTSVKKTSKRKYPKSPGRNFKICQMLQRSQATQALRSVHWMPGLGLWGLQQKQRYKVLTLKYPDLVQLIVSTRCSNLIGGKKNTQTPPKSHRPPTNYSVSAQNHS